MNDPYAVLGVSRSATDDEIKQAYRRLAKKYHPDLHPGDPKAAAKMNEINEAYDMIKDAAARQQYQQQQTYSYNPYGGRTSQQTDQQDPFAGYANPFGFNYEWHDGASHETQGDSSQWNPFNYVDWTQYRPRRRGSFLWTLIKWFFIINILLRLASCLFSPFYYTRMPASTAPQTPSHSETAGSMY